MSGSGAPGPVRLLADDLTGALDTGARFTARHGALPVAFRAGSEVEHGSLVLDCATREAREPVARERAAELAGFFSGAGIAMRKIDTLMRGHPIAEIALGFRLGGFASCIVAPAFPAQGRVTRGGRQWAGDRDLSGPLIERLAGEGIGARHAADPDAVRGAGIFVCDASTDAELAAIVAAGRRLAPPVLWVGAAGLAAALGGGAARLAMPHRPLLAVIGSPHPVAMAQLAALERLAPRATLVIGRPDDEGLAAWADGVSVIGFRLPAADEVAAMVRRALDLRLHGMPPPASLLATGGETLRMIVETVGARRLVVEGEVADGIPQARIEGGDWHGALIVSKSGAFGDEATLVRLVAASNYRTRGERA